VSYIYHLAFIIYHSDPWHFLPLGYLLTVLIELPILCLGLSRRHSLRDRIVAGIWLTAATYPIVVVALPLAMENASLAAYLAVAETFAPLAECGLFYLAYVRPLPKNRRATIRDMLTVIAANLASFGCGELLWRAT
jgi:hypothetical protein